MPPEVPAPVVFQPRASTGCRGLDEALGGGLPAGRLYLLEGTPGSGKTTLALQFLLAGQAAGEACLYMTLSETAEEIETVARSHGWALGGITLFELSSVSAIRQESEEQTLLHPWELELGSTVKLMYERALQLGARRVVFDSLSELRLLAQDPLRYRRQVLAIKQAFAGQGITVLLIDDLSGRGERSDGQLHSLCHGVITLERLTLAFGAARRRLQIQKMRGIAFLEGHHDFVLRYGGVDMFTRLVAGSHPAQPATERMSSGLDALDALLRGGPLRGTSILVSGPAGSGKTVLAMQYVLAACRRGERACIYEFDERLGTLLTRGSQLGMDAAPFLADGRLHMRQIDPAELSPGEFAAMIRSEVERDGVRVVVIDSLNGYLSSMVQEQQLILQLHELLSYLGLRGVLTLLLNPQQGVLGWAQSPDLNISYIADTVLLLRFFEAAGRIRRAISAIKNRSGDHENTIREFRIAPSRGIVIGEPLTEFNGVLSGSPSYLGREEPLLPHGDEEAGE